MQIRIHQTYLLDRLRSNNTVKKCCIGLGLSTVHIMPNTTPTQMTVLPFIEENKTLMAKKLSPKSLSWDEAAENIARLNKEAIAKMASTKLARKQNAVVLAIMQEDTSCSARINKEKVARDIVRIANQYKADPVTIACIAKHESHFTEFIAGMGGTGILQVSKIAAADMFQRPDLYGKDLKNIIKSYKSSQHLFKDLEHNTRMNLRIGTLKFNYHLKDANGNIREALKSYNASPHRNIYANEIMSDIKKYKKKLKLS